MDYEEAKLHKQKLNDSYDLASSAIREFDTYGKSPIGTTPDHVRAMPEWKEAKRKLDTSFAELRSFNGWFVKKFRKRSAADRKRN